MIIWSKSLTSALTKTPKETKNPLKTFTGKEATLPRHLHQLLPASQDNFFVPAFKKQQQNV